MTHYLEDLKDIYLHRKPRNIGSSISPTPSYNRMDGISYALTTWREVFNVMFQQLNFSYVDVDIFTHATSLRLLTCLQNLVERDLVAKGRPDFFHHTVIVLQKWDFSVVAIFVIIDLLISNFDI